MCLQEAILLCAGKVFSSSTISFPILAVATGFFLGACLLSKTTQARRWILDQNWLPKTNTNASASLSLSLS